MSALDGISSTAFVAPGSGVVAITGASSNRAAGTKVAAGAGAAHPPPKTATKDAPDNTNSRVSDRTCFRIEIGMTYSSETDNVQRMVLEAHKTKGVLPNFCCVNQPAALTGFKQDSLCRRLHPAADVRQPYVSIFRTSVGVQRQSVAVRSRRSVGAIRRSIRVECRRAGDDVIPRKIGRMSLGC